MAASSSAPTVRLRQSETARLRPGFQLAEDRSGRTEVGGLEALGDPAVDGSELSACLVRILLEITVIAGIPD